MCGLKRIKQAEIMDSSQSQSQLIEDIKQAEEYRTRITIDNNRELDSDIFDKPYNPNSILANWNFKN